jgi:hypothetical protein
MAHERIRELADQAAHVRKLFEESVLQARQAAGELLRTPFSDTAYGTTDAIDPAEKNETRRYPTQDA